MRRLKAQLERLLPYLPDEEQELIMADFTAANTALAALQSTATEVVSAFNALKATDDQAGVDALTNGIDGVQTQLAALVPAPAAPAP